MRKVQERPASPFVNIAGSDCAAAVSAIRAFDDRRAIDLIATHRCRPKARCVDSESQILAIKKFSQLARRRLIAARQNRIFGRIAAADSQARFFLAAMNWPPAINDRRALAHGECDGGDDAVVPLRNVFRCRVWT
jgi:hypothetical protein